MTPRRRHRRTAAYLAAALVAAAGGPVLAAPSAAAPTLGPPGITVTELPGLGGDVTRSLAINDRGQVVGEGTTAGGDTHALVWDLREGGEPVDLTPTPPGGTARFVNRRGVVAGTTPGLVGDTMVWEQGEATPVPPGLNIPKALNDRGDVLTWAFDRDRPWLPPATNVWRDGELAVAPSLPDGAPFFGLDISNRGTVVGPGFSPGQVTTWRPGEALKTLALPEGALSAGPVAINDADVVMGVATYGDGRGQRVVRWLNGVPREIGTLGGATSGYSGGANPALRPINIWGHMVGLSETAAGETHAFLWRNGRMTDLGTLGGDESFAFGVNDVGQVVGLSLRSDGTQHPFLWQNGHMLDLTTLPGLEDLIEVTGINNRGEIIGSVGSLFVPEARPVVVRVPPLDSLAP